MLLRRLLILGTLLSLAACGGSLGSIDQAANCTAVVTDVTQVTVFPTTVRVLPTGQPFRMVAQAYNGCEDPVSGVSFRWQSSNPNVASVSGDGSVRGISGTSGTTTISASVSRLAKGLSAPNAAAAAPGESLVVFVNGTTDDRTVENIKVYPPDPVVASGFQLQMSALAFNRFGEVIPSASLSWTTTASNVASIANATGLVSGNSAGNATIRVQPAGIGSFGSLVETPLVVREVNGGAPAGLQVVLTSHNVVLVSGERDRIFAQLRDPETNRVLAATFSWTPSTSGVVDLIPSAETDFVDITASAAGSITLGVTAFAGGITYIAAPVDISVLNSDPTLSGDWTAVGHLPIATTGLGLSVSGDYLVATGGVTSRNFTGGPREQVMRARLHHTGPLFNLAGLQGWDLSQSGDVNFVLAACNVEPTCMQINRDDADLPTEFLRRVRYQVFGHGQVATDSHIYVIGGIDAQVDLGIAGPIGIGAVGPNDTRFSDRTIIAAIGTDGTINGWTDGPKLPQVGVSAGDVDIPGSYAPGVTRYGNWIYVTGGWGAVVKASTGQIIGRNRDEVFRAAIQPDGSLGAWQHEALNPLPQPLNKHQAAVVEVPGRFGGANRVYLVVSGGSTGVDQFSPDSVSKAVYFAELDPLTGGFMGAGNWQVGTSLPKALEFHAMVNIPGTPTLVVTGGDNILTSSRESYMIDLDPSAGVTGGWSRLPLLPSLSGLTTHAATAVSLVQGVPKKRVYVAGGGQLQSGSDFQLSRSDAVYYLDIK